MNDIFVLSLVNSDQLCLIDSWRVEDVVKYKWKIDKRGYIYRKVCETVRGFLHQHIFKKRFLDHINRLKWDNRECNLRRATASNQGCNRDKFPGKYTSKYKGVSLAHNNKWSARITKNRKTIYIGLFTSEIEAANAYNKQAISLHENFANLNIIC